MRKLLLLVALQSTLLACSDDTGEDGGSTIQDGSDNRICVPGNLYPCQDVDGCSGAQECNPEGSAFLTCVCGAVPTANTGGTTSAGGSSSIGGGTSAGGGTTGTGGSSGCRDAFAYAIDQANGCVTLGAPEPIGCATQGVTGNDYCAKRISDRVVFAVTSPINALDPTVWETCSFEERMMTMTSCEIREVCGELAPYSACSMEETYQQFGCSTVAALDDNCCLLRLCETDPSVCDPGFECQPVPHFPFDACRYEWDGVCRCSGLPRGDTQMRCYPTG